MATKTKRDTSLHAVTEVAGFRQATAKDVKSWAGENGFTVKEGRGRMPMEVVHAFNAAKARNKVQYILATDAQPEQEYAYTTAKGRSGKFRAQPKDIRAWAVDNGHEVGARGRFRQDVLDAYGQALRSK